MKRDVQLADHLVHEAAHAVIAWEIGVPIIHLRFSAKQRSGEMPYSGAVGDDHPAFTTDAMREQVEKDMLLCHAGTVAQRLFHYDGTLQYVSPIDAAMILRTCLKVESDIALIDEWSEYAEERVRVMLYRPTTWARVIALSSEIARKLYLTGDEIGAFLRCVDVTDAVSPKDRPWKREQYPIGRTTEVLSLSSRARRALDNADITTIAELLTYSAMDLRGTISSVGPKTVAEIEEAVRALGLHLAEGRRHSRELLVDRARRELP